MPEQRREVVTSLLIHPTHGVLLQQRDDKPELRYPGWWTTFGGGVEDDETPDEAIRRELLEELELDIPLTFWYAFPCPVRSVPNEVVTINHVYLGMLEHETSELTLHEGQGMAYFDPQIAAGMALAFRQEIILQRYLAEKPVFFKKETS